MESDFDVQYRHVLPNLSPCTTEQHMERMKVSQHASRISDINKNNSCNCTYQFQAMVLLDGETYNGKDIKCVIKRIKLHKQRKFLFKIRRFV